MWEAQADAMRTALTDHDQIIETAVDRNEGRVFKTGGDGFCASFASPILAVTAAIEAQRELAAFSWETAIPVKARMGVHTGTAQLRDDDYYGPTLNRTARIMDAGHGGQILVSSATRVLVIDELPPAVDLIDLGVQHLRDLDRPETIYQVSAPGLQEEFPQLRSNEGRTADPAARAEAAYKAKDWSGVHDALVEIETERSLTGRQHDLMGYALWWLGEDQDIVPRFELAFRTYVDEGDPRAASIAALQLAELHSHNLAGEVAAGWVRRAERLLEGDEDSVSKGYLLRWQATKAFESDGDIEKALELSRGVEKIAKAVGDGNLEVLALQDQGRVLVAAGRLDEGMPLMDEAMIGAVAGDVNPMVVGRSYCNMLSVCNQTGDVRRAAEWSEAAERWCRDSESSPYPGICRVFKAEVMWQNGDWVGAESEVMKASTEMGLYTDISGEAWYQYGEMRLRSGDDQGAEEAFQQALSRGREPVPGYAMILARKGNVDEAVDILERTLADARLSKLSRARFLPGLVELTLRSGDLARAETACSELAEIAELARSDFFKGQALRAQGNIDLARGNPKEALEHSREAMRIFSRLGLPFEAAEAHSDMADAYEADGVPALAAMEKKAAQAEFDRLKS